MTKHLSTYIDKNGGSPYLFVAIVGDIILAAEEDGVTELLVTKQELHEIKRYMISCGHNWDKEKKTFWGIKLTVKE